MMLGKGEATLVAGTKAVSLPRITTSCVVLLSPRSLLGTIGALSYTITAGTGFTITSLSVLDVSIVAWAAFV